MEEKQHAYVSSSGIYDISYIPYKGEPVLAPWQYF